MRDEDNLSRIPVDRLDARGQNGGDTEQVPPRRRLSGDLRGELWVESELGVSSEESVCRSPMAS